MIMIIYETIGAFQKKDKNRIMQGRQAYNNDYFLCSKQRLDPWFCAVSSDLTPGLG